MFLADDMLYGMLGTSALLGLGGIGTSLGLGLGAQSASESAAKRQTREAARQFDENMQWQREQYQRNQDFVQMMSNTAHQREVEDLRAAGLNPILSAGGNGASTTVPSSPSSAPTALSSIPDPVAGYTVMQRGISSALDSASLAAMRYGQTAESLSKASQNSELTHPMKLKLLAEMQSASSMADKFSAEADSLDALTPARRAYLEGMSDWFKHRGNYDWWNLGFSSAFDFSREARGWSQEFRRWKRGMYGADLFDEFLEKLEKVLNKSSARSLESGSSSPQWISDSYFNQNSR